MLPPKSADPLLSRLTSRKNPVPAILVDPARPGSQACIISHFTLIERMTNFQRLATVRKQFLHWLQNVDEGSGHVEADETLICHESVLFRDEFFCGRKFIGEHYHAVWFIEEDVLKIYRADGPLELVLRGAEIDDYGAKPIEGDFVAEKGSVAPLAVSPTTVQPLNVTAEAVISEATSVQASVPQDAVAQDSALEDAVREDPDAVREDPAVEAGTPVPVATTQPGPRILQMPAANGDSNQSAAAATADQIEPHQSENHEIRKAA
jgi:hypothetical protein